MPKRFCAHSEGLVPLPFHVALLFTVSPVSRHSPTCVAGPEGGDKGANRPEDADAYDSSRSNALSSSKDSRSSGIVSSGIRNPVAQDGSVTDP